jgi:hypothetical protein
VDTLSERADRELERMVERRSPNGQTDPDEQKALYAESVRRYNARRREENRLAWREYHQGQAERLRRTVGPLIAFHEERAVELGGIEPGHLDTPRCKNGVYTGGRAGLGEGGS